MWCQSFLFEAPQIHDCGASSIVGPYLWLMDDKTRAAGIVLLAASTGRILLAQRAVWINPNQGEVWAGWGGHAKPGETPSQTAVRELQEETQYDGPITLFKASLYHRPDTNFAYQNFIGVIPEEFDPQLDLETEDAMWVTMSELYGRDDLPLLPEFNECLIGVQAELTEMIKGLGILNENHLLEPM